MWSAPTISNHIGVHILRIADPKQGRMLTLSRWWVHRRLAPIEAVHIDVPKSSLRSNISRSTILHAWALPWHDLSLSSFATRNGASDIGNILTIG